MTLALRTLSEFLAPKGLLVSIGATVIVRAALILVSMATTVLIARQLGPSGRGEYAVAITISAIGVQIANLGIHTSSSWAVARNRRLLGPLLANGLILAATLGTATALIAAALLLALPLTPLLPPALLLIALLGIPFGVAYLVGQNLLLGIQHIRAYNFLELANRISGFAGIFLLSAVGVLTATWATASSLIALVTVTVAGAVYLRRKADHPARAQLGLARDFGAYGFRVYVAALLTFLVLRLDLLLVERMLGTSAAGQYSIAVSIAEVVTLPAIVAATILFPRLSAISEESDRRSLTSRYAWWAALATGALGVVAALSAEPIIAFLFGPSFLPAVTPLTWLIPGAVGFAAYSVLMSYFYSIGTPALTILFPALGLLVNVSMNLALIPAYGLVGTAVASSCSYGCMLLLASAWFALRRTTREQSAS